MRTRNRRKNNEHNPVIELSSDDDEPAAADGEWTKDPGADSGDDLSLKDTGKKGLDDESNYEPFEPIPERKRSGNAQREASSPMSSRESSLSAADNPEVPVRSRRGRSEETQARNAKYSKPGEDLDWTKVTNRREQKRLQSLIKWRRHQDVHGGKPAKRETPSYGDNTEHPSTSRPSTTRTMSISNLLTTSETAIPVKVERDSSVETDLQKTSIVQASAIADESQRHSSIDALTTESNVSNIDSPELTLFERKRASSSLMDENTSAKKARFAHDDPELNAMVEEANERFDR